MTNLSRTLTLVGVAAFVQLLAFERASAQATFSWVGPQSQWTATSAWSIVSGASGSGYPGATDTISITEGSANAGILVTGAQSVLDFGWNNSLNQAIIGQTNGSVNILGTLTKAGTGVLTFRPSGTTANSLSLAVNNITLNAGQLLFGATDEQGLSSFTSAGTTQLNTGTLSFNLLNTGTASLGTLNAAGGTMLVRNSSNVTGTNTVAVNTLNGTAGTISVGSTAGTYGILQVSSGSVGGTLGLTDAASTTLELVKVGSGTLTMNSLTSSTLDKVTVKQGVLAYVTGGNADQFGGSTNLTIDGGTIDLANRADGIGSFTLISGTLTGSGGRLNATNGYELQSGVVIGLLGAGGSLTKTTSGTVTVSGNNSYTGPTTINGGVMAVTTIANGGANSTLGNNSNAAANLVLNGGVLAYAGTVAGSTDRLFTLGTNGGGISSIGTQTLTFANTGAVVLAGSDTARTFTLGGSNTGDNVFALSLADNGTGKTSLVKDGVGKWIVTANNTFTGTTAINGGTLQIGNGGGTGSVGGPIVNNGNLILARSGTYTASSVGGAIAGTGNVQVATSNTVSFNVANTFSGTVSALTQGVISIANLDAFQNATVAPGGNGRLVVDSGLSTTGTIAFGGFISSNGFNTGSSRALSIGANNGYSEHTAGTLTAAGGLIKVGTGTLSLGSIGSFGSVSLNGGTLLLNSANAIGATGNITFGGGTLAYSANNTTDYSARFNAVASGQQAKINTNGQNVTFASGISGSGGLQKLGSGTLTVSANNTFTGTTSVSGGTLLLSAASNNIANSAVIDVSAGAILNVANVSGGFVLASAQTLKGNGTIEGAITIGSGATLAIGNSPGTMTFAGGLTLAAGSVSNFEINGLTTGLYDLAQDSGIGSVAFGGTLNLVFAPDFSTQGTVKIFDFDNYSGSFSAVNATGLASGYYASFNAFTGEVTVVPEPSTWALLGLGLGALVWRSGLRRRKL